MTDLKELNEKLDLILQYSVLSAKEMLTVNEVSLLTGLEINYIYRLTSNKEIPYYKPNGKQIYFSKKEIEKWLKRGRVLTNDEIFEAVKNNRSKKNGKLERL